MTTSHHTALPTRLSRTTWHTQKEAIESGPSLLEGAFRKSQGAPVTGKDGLVPGIHLREQI